MNQLRRIMVIGNSIEAWLSAAYLRARLPRNDYQIIVIETAENSMASSHTIFARPSSKNLHHILDISEANLSRVTHAKPALCATITNSKGAIIELPFGQYGVDREGTEFQHIWKFSGSQQPLAEFNLALMMHKAGLFINNAPKGAPTYDYGYILDEQGYENILKSKASTQHIIANSLKLNCGNKGIEEINCNGESLSADLYIDVRSNDFDMAWNHNHLKIMGGFDMLDHQSGMRLYRIQMAMERLFKLWPDREFAAIEIAEYNRLEKAQSVHINDMNRLLQHNIQGCSDALKRKIRLFESRGRIAIEDFEIYSKAEWIAALKAIGISAQNYDRLAHRISAEAALQWIDQLHTAIANLVQQLSNKNTGKQ